jgi:hypothetical protein
MNFNNFLKFNNKGFFEEFVPLKPKTYTIVIIYNNGHRYEKHCIENPWRYLQALKKNPQIKDAYIKP